MVIKLLNQALESPPPPQANQTQPAQPAAAQTPPAAAAQTPAANATPPQEGDAAPAEQQPPAPPQPADTEVEPLPIVQPEQGRFSRWRDNLLTRRSTVRYEYDEGGRVTSEVRERRGPGVAVAVGALAVVAVVGAVAWEVFEHKVLGHGSSREVRQQFLQNCWHKHHSASNGVSTDQFNKIMNAITAHDHSTSADHAKEMADHAQLHAEHAGIVKDLHAGPAHAHGGQAHNLLDINDIHSDTITAHTPAEFQQNVVQLLKDQGLHVNGDTPHRLAQMSTWMNSHQIASGVNSDHSQHLVRFSQAAFDNPSHQLGFKIGPNGTGDPALHSWIKHAKSIGINISA